MSECRCAAPGFLSQIVGSTIDAHWPSLRHGHRTNSRGPLVIASTPGTRNGSEPGRRAGALISVNSYTLIRRNSVQPSETSPAASLPPRYVDLRSRSCPLWLATLAASLSLDDPTRRNGRIWEPSNAVEHSTVGPGTHVFGMHVHKVQESTVNSTAAPIPFARSMLRQHRHVSAFFSSPEAEYDTLLPFIRDGTNCGQRAVLPSRQDHIRRLRNAGIDVERAQTTRQLELALSEDT